MKVRLTQDDIQLGHGVCQEKDRPQLQTIAITDGKATVADGYILARRDVETKGEGAIGILPKKLKGFKGNITATTIRNKLYLHDGLNGKTMITKLDQSYAGKGYHHAIKETKGKEPTLQIALNAKLLLKALSCLPKNAELLRLRFRGQEDPIEFYSEGTTGLIMPMLTDWQHDWKETNWLTEQEEFVDGEDKKED